RRADGGEKAGLDGERLGHAVGLARAQREQEVPRLEIVAAHEVGHAEADARRTTGVDALEGLARDLIGRAAFEAKPAQAPLRASHEQREQRASRCLRDAHPDGEERRAQDLEALIEVAATQELLGAAAAQVAIL